MKGVKIEEEKVIVQQPNDMNQRGKPLWFLKLTTVTKGNHCDWSEFKSEPNYPESETT